MRVGRRCLRQCRKTQRNLLCCPAALNHGGQHRLTDRIWSSVWDRQPSPRPRQPAGSSERVVALHTPAGPDESLALSAPDALCVYAHVHTHVLALDRGFQSILFLYPLLALQNRWKECIYYAARWFERDLGSSSQGNALVSATNRVSHVDRCWEQIGLLTDTLGCLWALEQPWIFPQANGGASINIHWVSCDLQWERASQHSLGGTPRSPHWQAWCLRFTSVTSSKDTAAPALTLNINTAHHTVWTQHALSSFLHLLVINLMNRS